jgi:hypothetical protein
MTYPGFSRLRGLCLAISLLMMIAALGSRAAEPVNDAQPALIIAYHTTPTNWTAFRKAVRSEDLPHLRALQKEGILRSYHVFFNRHVDSADWNAMAMLTFNGPDGLARWTQSARQMPGGLTQDELALTSQIETTPVNLVRHGVASKPASAPVTLVIPYRYLVSDAAYLKYLDGYTIPQLKGWMDAGVLARYTILMAQYPAGRPWSAMLVLEYRSDGALAARDGVKERVRAKLSNDPAWKAISDDKKAVREELALTLADDVDGN